MEFLDKKILIAGLGKSGLSAARWLSGAGAEVTVSDIKTEVEINHSIFSEALSLGIKLETGIHRKETFLNSEMIIISPGVPYDSELLMEARARGIPVMGEMELAGRLIDIPIVAVTGTNGKSTATDLMGGMLKRAGLKVFVGGNIGTPFMDYLTDAQMADYAVLEISSFQLDSMETFCPYISVLLNISPDHLDRYTDYDAYIRSKMKIFQNQGFGHYAIINDDDKILSKYEFPPGLTILRYGLKERGNCQAFIKDKKMRACLPGMGAVNFDLGGFVLQGTHNIQNLMSVVLVGLALRLDKQIIQETIDHYRGLSHRLEFVKRVNNIDFYNDSKATNVDAALKSIMSFNRPVILIAGGIHKGGKYSPLVRAARDQVKKAVFLGEAKHLLAESFEGDVPFTLVEDMREAVSQAFSSAAPEDVVLLAPACASFDMFSDYAHRGRIFQAEVEGLANGQ